MTAAAFSSPAVLPVRCETVEVAPTSFGLRCCHYVGRGGAERRLVAETRSAEGRRARFERSRPGLSRLVAAVSLLMLLIRSAWRPPGSPRPSRRSHPSPNASARSTRRWPCPGGSTPCWALAPPPRVWNARPDCGTTRCWTGRSDRCWTGRSDRRRGASPQPAPLRAPGRSREPAGRSGRRRPPARAWAGRTGQDSMAGPRHSWLAAPLQSQMTRWWPLCVPKPGASTHLPEWTLRRLPLGRRSHRWLSAPWQRFSPM